MPGVAAESSPRLDNAVTTTAVNFIEAIPETPPIITLQNTMMRAVRPQVKLVNEIAAECRRKQSVAKTR
jgi:hypothetical protein